MKNIIFKTLFLGSLAANFISCNAQLPLSTFMENIPQNAHVKDLNNELNPYIGIYKTNYQGKEIILYITKQNDRLTDYGDQKFYRDALIVKYIVKNSSGTIVQDTQNNNLSTNAIYSTRIRSYDSTVLLGYEGTNCRIGWGTILLKKINATQISWLYQPNDRVILPGQCPGNPDLKIYLPETENPLIFTKQ